MIVSTASEQGRLLNDVIYITSELQKLLIQFKIKGVITFDGGLQKKTKKQTKRNLFSKSRQIKNG